MWVLFWETVVDVCLSIQIYAGRTHEGARRDQQMPSPEPNVATPPMAGAFRAPHAEERQAIPDIIPMRRGRPDKANTELKVAKPSPSPLRATSDDPFVALDSAPTTAPEDPPLDDASIRFPPLDDFSLLHDSGGKFAFDQEATKKAVGDISQRVTNALADDAFAQPTVGANDSTQNQSEPPHIPSIDTKANVSAIDIPKSNAAQFPHRQQSLPQRPGMVSTGTMTSSSPPSPTIQNTSNSNRPIFHFPPSSPGHRSSSLPRASDVSELAAATLRAEAVGQRRPSLLDQSRSQLSGHNSTPSQPSPGVGYRSSYLSSVDGSIQRSKSETNSKARPTSVQAPSKPNVLRRLSRERPRADESTQDSFTAPLLNSAPTADLDDGEEVARIDSNVDYLKAMEEGDTSKRKEKRLSSGSRHIKRASMPSVSLSGTKSLLAGRFGEAFRRFETNTGSPEKRDSSCSPVRATHDLTPIAGSEATDDRSDDGNALEESEEIPPEMRRELERRRLSQEEKRVADAAAAYRKRRAEGGEDGRGRPGTNKAASIQSKVRSLLDESGRASPSPTTTASGYGRYTDSPEQQPLLRQVQQDFPLRTSSRQVPSNSSPDMPPYLPATNKPSLSSRPSPTIQKQGPTLETLPHHSATPSNRPFTRLYGPPKPQPKPQILRTGDRPPKSPAKPPSLVATKPISQQKQQQQEQLLDSSPLNGGSDDWETNFSKRYPNLSGLEMVETEIDSATAARDGGGREMRVRDV